MLGILLAAGYTALLLWWIRRSPFFALPGLRKRHMAAIFLLKVLAGVGLWWLYTHVYTDRSTADIYKYFDDSAVMYGALWKHPIDFLQMLLGIGNDTPYFGDTYYHVMDNWHRKYESNLANDSHTMIRFNAAVRILSGGHFHVHTVITAFLAFTGMTAICKAFVPALPDRRMGLYAAVYLIPSVLFWASGVIKESLLFFGLGLLLWKLFQWMQRRVNWKDLVVIVFCTVLLFFLKFYVLLSMAPALIALAWCRLRPGRPVLKFIVTFAVLIPIVLNLQHVIRGFDVLEVLWWKYKDFIGLAASMDSGSFVMPPPMEPTFWSFLKNAPHALYMTFFSPVGSWGQGLLGKAAAVETLFLLATFVCLLIHLRRENIDTALVLFCLSFALVLALVIGWTTPVIGAIVRYRVPLLPFIMIIALLLTDPKKIRWSSRIRLGNTPVIAALLMIAGSFMGCAHQNRPADLIVHNAYIITLDSAEHVYEAMAVKDGRILEMGAEQQIRNRYNAKETYDAAGQPIYPGFIDGHCHFLGYGLNKQKADLKDAKSWDEVLERTAAFARSHPDTGWLLGRGWDQNLWADKDFPDNIRLNELIPDRPVLLQRVDGHAAVVNQAALDRVGLTAKSTIAGGLLEVRDGRATGLLVDNVVEVYQKIFDDAEAATKRQALLDAQRDCLAAGLTMVVDAGLDVNTIELIQQMQQEGALKIRIYAMVSDKPENLEHFASTGPIINDRLIVRAVKCYADGALGSRGALLLKPYSDVDSTWNGLLRGSREHFLGIAQWCKAHDFQMATHCIGDSADRLLLGVYGEVLGGTNDLRWRIEHAQCMDPADFAWFNTYTVIPSVQPTHATSDMLWADERLGSERLVNAYAYKRLLKENGLVALGTDFPVEGISPINTFYSAVFRKNHDGVPEGGFQMNDALTRAEALRGMTIWNAISTFTEKDLGTLEVGKRADFVVLDRDILQVAERDVAKAKVIATYVNGEHLP